MVARSLRIAGTTSLAALAAIVSLHCSLIAKSDVDGAGLGASCSGNDDCHAGVCEQKICVATCTASPDCPPPTACYASRCQLPLKVTGLWVGVVAGGEGWTLTHQEGMEEAARRLPYLKWDYKESIIFDGVGPAVDEAIKSGSTVIVSNSFSQRADIMKKVDECDPDKAKDKGPEAIKKAEGCKHVKFLQAASFVTNGKSTGSFTARSEQAWYIAGKVAANKATKRIGIIGSFITPESVRHINAYALGARSVKPELVVEVNWIGFWFDYRTEKKEPYEGEMYFREEALARRLIDSGCEVIAHLGDNQRAVRVIERLVKEMKVPNVFSLTNDNKNAYREITPTGPGAALTTCLGGAFWNWGPQYARLFDDIHRGVWKPTDSLNEPIIVDANESIAGFQLNAEVGIDDSVVRSYTNDMVQRGPDAVFQGPYDTTGQRSKNGDKAYDAVQALGVGEKISDKEYYSMCWFANGIVERRVPKDPATERPAKVPDDREKIVDFDPTILDPPGAPRGVAFNCRENQ